MIILMRAISEPKLEILISKFETNSNIKNINENLENNLYLGF